MNQRKKALDATRPPYDMANPPEGTRLWLGKTAAALGVTVTRLAEATGISRSAIANLFQNRWPVKVDRAVLSKTVEDLLRQHGASEHDIAVLWQAHTRIGYADPRPAEPAPPDTAPAPRAQADTPPTEEDDMLPLKAVLTPQAKRHFKLFANPFDGPVIRDEQMFAGAEFAYVREAAWQCAQTGAFVAIVGESGAGKTTMLEDLESRLQHDTRGTVVIKPSVVGMEVRDRGMAIRSGDILHAIITALDPETPVPQTVQARTNKAKKMLSAGVSVGNQYLLVVEEAHSMPDATLKHLKRLHELRDGRRPLMGILLLAQPELKRRLADGLRDGTLREVAQRCELVELLPLDNDLKAFLECRARAGGVELAKLLDDEAVQAIRTRLTRPTSRGAVSMCYPLAVSNLVTRALNAAAELGAPVVTRDIVAHA